MDSTPLINNEQYLKNFNQKFLNEFIDHYGMRYEHCTRPKNLDVVSGFSLFGTNVSYLEKFPDTSGADTVFQNEILPWTFSLVCENCGHIDSYKAHNYINWMQDKTSTYSGIVNTLSEHYQNEAIKTGKVDEQLDMERQLIQINTDLYEGDALIIPTIQKVSELLGRLANNG